MSLGLGDAKPLKPFELAKEPIRSRMMTTESSLPGFKIETNLGPVGSTAERSMAGIALPHLEIHAGGKLEELVGVATRNLADAADVLGANAVIGLRYAITGRDYEKSVLAYGTAVVCRKKQQGVAADTAFIKK